MCEAEFVWENCCAFVGLSVVDLAVLEVTNWLCNNLCLSLIVTKYSAVEIV